MAHKPRSLRSPTTESPAARYTLMAVAFLFLALFLLLPLAAVFVEAFRKGPGEFLTAFGDPDTLAAARELLGDLHIEPEHIAATRWQDAPALFTRLAPLLRRRLQSD